MSEEEYTEEDVIIRNYRTSDYNATLEILRELHSKYDIGLNEDKWRESSGLRQFKPNLKRITLIAEVKSSGEVIAMGVIEAQKSNLGQYIGYLDNWATKQEFVGKNVGKILADRATQMLKSWGCESIRINLGYGVPEKLLKVFGRTGFKPVLVVLEKRIAKEEE
jgi:hypothetical protein